MTSKSSVKGSGSIFFSYVLLFSACHLHNSFLVSNFRTHTSCLLLNQQKHHNKLKLQVLMLNQYSKSCQEKKDQ